MAEITELVTETTTTQQPLGTDNLPIGSPKSLDISNIKFRGVSDPSLSREASTGLRDLVSKAGSNFTITSASRLGDDGLHGTGNAIDFGVKDEDGKNAMNFFFNDDAATEISTAGSQFLVNNNAELVDERTNPDGAHFHLEFNSKNGPNFINADGEQSVYADGRLTTEGSYPIFGVKNSFKENPFNLSPTYAKVYNDLLEEGAKSLDISQGSPYMNAMYGVNSSAEGVASAQKPEGVTELDNYVTEAPEEDRFDPYVEDGIKSYSSRGKAIQYFKDKDWEWNSNILEHNSEADIRQEYRNRGVTMFAENNLAEAAGRQQGNWNKLGRGMGGFATTLSTAGTSMGAFILAGLPAAIHSGNFNSIYTNPVNTAISEMAKWRTEKYPHHATEEQKNSTINTNFWTQQLPEGLGFLVGAAISGGMAAEAKIGEKVFKTINRVNPKSIWRAQAAAWRSQSLGLSMEKSRRMVDLLGKVATRSKAANFYGAGIASALGEASIEANSIYWGSVEQLKGYREQGDPRFANMSDGEVEDAAAAYGNVAFLANVAVVGATNLMMFKNLFKSGYKNTSSNILKGLIKRKGLKLGVKEYSKKRIFTKTKLLSLKKPLAEMSEEWAQFGLEKGGHDYFEYEYRSDKGGIASFLDGFVGITGSIARGIAKTPTEIEGRQSMLLGFMLGFLGEQGGRLTGAPTEGQTWKAKYENTKKQVDDFNILTEDGELYRHIDTMARLEAAEGVHLDALERGDIYGSKTQEALKLYHTLKLARDLGQMDVIESILEDAAKMSEEEFGETFNIAGYEEGSEPNKELIPNRVNVNKQIDSVRSKIKDFKTSFSSVEEGIESVIEDIASKFKGSPEELAKALPYLKSVLTYYSFMTKDMDRREGEIKAEMSELSSGILNTTDLDSITTEKSPKEGESFWDKAAAMYKTKAEEWEKSKNPNVVDKVKGMQLFMDAMRIGESKRHFRELVNGLYNSPQDTLNKAAKAAPEPVTPAAETEMEEEEEQGRSEEEVEEELRRQQQGETETEDVPEGDKPTFEEGAEELAEKLGVDFSMMEGTGPLDSNGNKTITKADVEAYAKKKTSTIPSSIEAIIKVLKSNKDFIQLSEDESHYVNTKTGKEYRRVTHTTSEEDPEETPMLKSAQSIGTAVDEFVRDFFSPQGLKKMGEYSFAPKPLLHDFAKHLQELKAGFDARGETVVSEEIVLYNDDLGVAGTVDLLTYDKDGVIRIYDMKTMRGDQLVDKRAGEKVSKYDSTAFGLSNREKHQRQLSVYRILLNNTHGILAKELVVLAIPVYYQPGGKKTSRLPSSRKPIKRVQVEPLDTVPLPRNTKDAVLNKAKSKVKETVPKAKKTSTKTSTEKDAPIPANEQDDTKDNEDQVNNTDNSSGFLSNILKAAWKSTRNYFNGKGKDLVTSNFLENPLTGNMKGKKIYFGFDLEYMTTQKKSAHLVDKIKNKEDLTDEELGILAIKGELQVANEDGPVVVYVHEEGHIHKYMKPELQDQAIKDLLEYRRAIYKAYQEGKTPTTVITRMSGGHITVRKNKDGSFEKNNPRVVVNGGFTKGRKEKLVLVANSNTQYTDEAKAPHPGLIDFQASVKTNGAIYTILKMANGKMFPLRLFVSNVTKDMADVVVAIYIARATGRLKSLNIKVADQDLNHWSGNSPLAEGFMKYFSNRKGRGTYSQMLGLITYEGNTPGLKFDTKAKTLTIGSMVIPFGEIEGRKKEIAAWIVANKRFNVKMSEANSTNNYEYNDWLADHGVIYTNARAHQATGSAFVQPSLEFGPIEGEKRKPLPKKTAAVKPKERVKAKPKPKPTEKSGKGKVEIVYNKNTKTRKGTKAEDVVPAFTRHNKDGSATIFINKEQLKEKYDEKAWTNPKIEGVTPFAEDFFASYEEWEVFVIGHEQGHAAEGPSTEKKGTPGYAAMENRMNQLGVEALQKYRRSKVKTTAEESTQLNLFPEEDTVEEFDKALNTKLQNTLQDLYPEIKLTITNSPQWESGANVLNQEEHDNRVEYNLKVVNALNLFINPKDTKRTRKYGEKPGVERVTLRLNSKTQPNIEKNIRKALQNKGATNEQIDLVFDYMRSKGIKEMRVEDVITSLLAENSFAVEVKQGVKKSSERHNENVEEATEEVEIEVAPGEYEIIRQVRQESSYYSSLTVPGGTNYTENEISTPAIVPNIKGHAQFSTDNGIGWFRSDEQKEGVSDFDRDLAEKIADGHDYLVGAEDPNAVSTNTRRILEVQSDLFQKGRDKKDLIGNGKEYYNTIDELPGDLGLTEQEKIDFKKDNLNAKENQFLQLLNKKSNWVNFFIQSIVQDSIKKGYTKVLFPTGKTAARVEGHQNIADDIASIDESIKITKDKIKNFKSILEGKNTETSFVSYDFATNNKLATAESKLEELKTSRQELKAQGLEKINPIEAFYSNRVTNTLNKLYDVKQITDGHGNTWNEVDLSSPKVLSEILLQKNEASNIIGQANIEAMTVLIDASLQKNDTLPHEYAHHYIAWNRESAIVQEAIKKWGSEEALVQAIGEQVIAQKGEALNWWNKFVKWLLGDLSKLSTLEKEKLAKILTDAFLTRQDLSDVGGKKATESVPTKPSPPKGESINVHSTSEKWSELSNFAYRHFTVEGDLWETTDKSSKYATDYDSEYNTVEGAFHAHKLFYAGRDMDNLNAEDRALIEKLKTSTGAQARKLGGQIKGLDVERWDSVSETVMGELMWESFEQNPGALQILLSTGNAILTHEYKGKEQDGGRFSRVLMEVRAEYQEVDTVEVSPFEEAPVAKKEEKGGSFFAGMTVAAEEKDTSPPVIPRGDPETESKSQSALMKEAEGFLDEMGFDFGGSSGINADIAGVTDAEVKSTADTTIGGFESADVFDLGDFAVSKEFNTTAPKEEDNCGKGKK